ncbi:Putative transcriptional regulator, XRE family [Flavobacterium indicum GPTSA100-9 = DSM 17447]|uniref:Putative transcriptional regulator, XRE family n=1 Tax=Flavobacterium indicum (strain DSM 17447 / CIP 109464 / GPTSA100-9) TaxID=1094466 RepID=H8XQK9_FLAIG|nr:helix-turn-helix transcriptional regulator [Flavobacterium indicum]CCG53307.1 Putative transcriptional regulator, XRE family [Flavobacterium indicum GPTSA100-9 = DSM 17447]
MQSEEFIKRLEKVFDYYGMSASSFADKIQVQRSSISHLLSGRNKPSLDFILKIVEHFSEVDIMWLLKGYGDFPKNNNEKDVTTTLSSPEINNIKTPLQQDLFTTEHEFSKNELFKNTIETKPTMSKIEKNEKENEIEQIVVFYKDGSFKLYK